MKENFTQRAFGQVGRMLTAALLTVLSLTASAQDYYIQIGGVQVNDDNKNDITAAINAQPYATATGSITFDTESNTLTLDHATVDLKIATGSFGIVLYVANCTVRLVGSNTLIYSTDATWDECMVASGEVRLVGDGMLSFDAGAAAVFGIELKDYSKLTIDGPTVDVTGSLNGIFGSRSDQTELNVNAGTLKAATVNGQGRASIEVATLTLGEGVTITKPEGAVFSNGAVGDSQDFTITTEVIITDGKSAGVHQLRTDNNQGAKAVAYDLQGRRVTDGFRGVVVRDGKKVVK